jgi:predicted CXXCH cytochrome family protein
VADTTCKTCHDGPQHHSNQAFTPPCVTCHAEHRGRQAALKVVEDRLCTQCHAALQAQGVAHSALLRVVGQEGLAISSFTSGHPEFAVQVGSERVRLSDRDRLRDVAQVQFNHVMHVKPNKRGPEGFEALKCSNCHQADAQRAYMIPITYEKRCMRCHPLEFDERFPKQVVPHSTPEVVHAFLDATLIRYCRDHLLINAAATKESELPQQLRPGTPRSTGEETRSIAQCAEEEVRGAAKAFLFAGNQQQGCRLCHVVQPPAADSTLPKIVKTAIPPRWLPHSVFNHQTHARAGRSCEDCHRKARASEQTTDVLLPGIASCQECHARASEVRSACVTCHVYHDRSELERGLPQYMEDRFVGRGVQLRNLPPP